MQQEYQIISVKNIIKANLVFFVILGIGIFLLYSNVIKGGFLTADDTRVFVDFPAAKNLQLALQSKQLYIVIRALVYEVFGLNPQIHHIIGILNHILNSWMVFILVYLLTDKKTALISSLIFATHPVNIETVCWLSAGTYLIVTSFLLLVLILFVRYKQTNKRGYLVFSLLVCLIQNLLNPSPWNLVAFLLLPVVEVFLVEKRFKKITSYWYYLPFAIIAFFVVIQFTAQQTKERMTELKEKYNFNVNGETPYFKHVPFSVYSTLELLIVPQRLTIYHEGELIPVKDYNLMVLVTIAIPLLVLFLLIKKGFSVYAGLIICIFLSTAPMYSPVQVSWYIAERYLYIGSMFFGILLSYLLLKLPHKYIFPVVAILISLYSLKIVIRSEDWVNDKKLWLSTLKTSPYSYRNFNNLGYVYSAEGNYQTAVGMFERAIQLNPQYADAMHNLATTYLATGEVGKAEEYFLKSLELSPKMYQSLYNLALIERGRGNLEKAKDYIQRAEEINSSDPRVQEASRLINQQPSTR